MAGGKRGTALVRGKRAGRPPWMPVAAAHEPSCAPAVEGCEPWSSIAARRPARLLMLRAAVPCGDEKRRSIRGRTTPACAHARLGCG